MQIVAKFNSTCPQCGKYINAGETVEWSKGAKARHVQCPAKASNGNGNGKSDPRFPEFNPPPGVLLASAPPQKTQKRNQKPGSCMNCGSWLKAGEGLLIFCPEDSGCMEHHDHSGYHVACVDPEGCKARREQAREAARKEKEFRAAKAEGKKRGDAFVAAEYQADKDRLTVGLVPLLNSPAGLVIGARIGQDHTGFYKRDMHEATLADGRRVYVEYANGYDDWRTYVYLPQDAALAEVDASLATHPITEIQAREWLSKYEGCCGAELYRRAAGLDPWTDSGLKAKNGS